MATCRCTPVCVACISALAEAEKTEANMHDFQAVVPDLFRVMHYGVHRVYETECVTVHTCMLANA
jgi:hypothetical protein